MARIVIDIEANARDAAREIDQTASKFDKFSSTMGQLAVPAGVAAGALIAVGKAAADSASTTEQAMGAVDSVFGASAAKVQAWSDTSATAVGLSQSAYLQLASVAGASLKSMGLSADDAATASGQLITLGADLAATFGGTTADAVSALTSALRGEADPAERLGLKLNQTAVAAKMAADGTDKLTGTAKDAAKAQAIMALATEQAAGANGQFARESGTAAGAQEIANAQFEDAKSAMGESLLPVVAALAEAMGGLSNFVKENTGLITGLVVVIGSLAAGVLAVNGALAVASAAQAIWNGLQIASKAATAAYTAVQWAFNAAMAANPVGLIIIAIVALIAGIVLLWKNCDQFREFFIAMWAKISEVATAAWDTISRAASACWDAIKGFITGVINALKGIFDSFVSGVTAAWQTIQRIATAVWDAIKAAATAALDAIMWPINKIKDAINWVITNIQKAIGFAQSLMSKIPFLGGLFSASSAAPAQQFWVSPGAPSLVGRGALAGPVGRASGSGGIVVNVNGALDPVAVGRQIRALLVANDRRAGGVRV